MSELKKTKKGLTYSGLILLVLFAAITVLGFVFYKEIFTDTGWFMTYDSGSELINSILRLVPKIIRSFMALFITLLVIYIVCSLIKVIFKGTPRRITIGKLVNSIVKVVIWAVAVIAVLAIWGVNVGALIAGAGVLTLVIGLGMQSLIADVVSGIFLVCDGTLQVGDIVTIDGWRGTVQEIGIRNTRLINASGDIRVANNSTIKIFVNQSREISLATVTVGIAYEEDIAKVEKIIEDNLESLKAKLPLVTDGPFYKGVDKLDSSSVNLLFAANCKEADIFQVQRDLNREIKILFTENGVNIPFPQVVVHTEKD